MGNVHIMAKPKNRQLAINLKNDSFTHFRWRRRCLVNFAEQTEMCETPREGDFSMSGKIKFHNLLC